MPLGSDCDSVESCAPPSGDPLLRTPVRTVRRLIPGIGFRGFPSVTGATGCRSEPRVALAAGTQSQVESAAGPRSG